MKQMKSIIMTIVLMVSFATSAQVDLSDYKYIVIPKKFDGFKQVNQHRTSTLAKYLFSKKGFTTVYDDNLPTELNSNRCLGLYVDLIDNSSMFTTKTSLVLKDCTGKEVLMSGEGRSKSKLFEEAFNESITKAFNSFVGLNYSYKPKMIEKQEEPVTISFKNDVKTVERNEKINKNQRKGVEQVATEEMQIYKDRTPTASNYKKAREIEKKVGEEKTSIEEQSNTTETPIPTNNETAASDKALSGVLYAQELPNGYQLVDSTPKIQLKMYKSSMPNVYVAKAEGKDGVVYTSDGKWFFEYYNGGTMAVEELNIKF